MVFLSESISFLNNQVQWFECSRIQFSKCEVSLFWPHSVTSQSEDLCLSLFSCCFYKIFWQEPLEVESVSFVLQIQRNRVPHCVGGVAAGKGGRLSTLQPQGRGYKTSKPTPLDPWLPLAKSPSYNLYKQHQQLGCKCSDLWAQSVGISHSNYNIKTERKLQLK